MVKVMEMERACVLSPSRIFLNCLLSFPGDVG